MCMYLGGSLALRFWRAAGLGLVECPHELCGPTLAAPRLEARAVHALRTVAIRLGIAGQTSAIDVYLFSREAIHHIRGVRPHVLSGPLPPGTFSLLDDPALAFPVAIASPALLTMQLGRGASSLLPLVELLYELCGSYSLAFDGSGSFTAHPPFASVADTERIVAALGSRAGAKHARRALAHARDNSASPRETVMCLLVALPVRLGGWGLPAPELNHRIDITGPACFLTDATCYFADECWPDAKVILEYDSDSFHLRDAEGGVDMDRVLATRQRREALEAMGWTVISITTEHTRDYAAFSLKMHQLARALGQRIRPCDKQVELRRRRLFHWLLTPGHTLANDARLLGQEG